MAIEFAGPFISALVVAAAAAATLWRWVVTVDQVWLCSPPSVYVDVNTDLSSRLVIKMTAEKHIWHVWNIWKLCINEEEEDSLCRCKAASFCTALLMEQMGWEHNVMEARFPIGQLPWFCSFPKSNPTSGFNWEVTVRWHNSLYTILTSLSQKTNIWWDIYYKGLNFRKWV